jgi:hypothetical protein
MSAATVELTIDAEFDELCFALTPEEQDLLEASLETEGCREPILVWANHDDTIIDGHNRYRICRSLGISFKTKALKFDSREDVVNWIISNQLGRRNATEEQKAYLRGKRYISEKHRHGGDRKSEESSPHSEDLKTAERIAGEYGVSRATIERDAKFASAVDDIAANVGKEARDAILTGKVKAEKKAVTQLAKASPAKQKAAVAAVVEGKASSLRQAIWDDGASTLKPTRDHSDADTESDALFHLKQWWSRAKKKDRTAFLSWIKEDKQ